MVLAVLSALVIWQHNLVGYGIAQAKGQLKILYKAKAIEKVLADASIPDSVKQKINLIQEIKKYAIDSLGIKPSGSYVSYYDQQNKPILWVLTACNKYSLKPYQWHFPFLGDVSYKGFFDEDAAEKEKELFKQQDYDTDIGEANAWSTLGWFNDPILSSMLKKHEGDLANLIIHELTHGTIYVKDSVEYNENLASFIGNKGALAFLKYKYGKDSNEYNQYLEGDEDRQKFITHILNGCNSLDSLYNGFNADLSDSIKSKQKMKLITEIIYSLRNINFHHPEKYQKLIEQEFYPNNAWFYGFIQYRQNQSVFENEFMAYHSNVKLYLEYLKKNAQNNFSE